MTGDKCGGLVDEDWVAEPELPDRGDDLLDLALAMRPGIAWIGFEGLWGTIAHRERATGGWSRGLGRVHVRGIIAKF